MPAALRRAHAQQQQCPTYRSLLKFSNPTHPQPWRLRLQLHLSRVVASNVESCVTNVCTIVKGSGTLNVRPPHACVRRGSGIVVDIERYKIYYFTTKSMTVFCDAPPPPPPTNRGQAATGGSTSHRSAICHLAADAVPRRPSLGHRRLVAGCALPWSPRACCATLLSAADPFRRCQRRRRQRVSSDGGGASGDSGGCCCCCRRTPRGRQRFLPSCN
jgi:hypothetical protein